MAKFLHIFDDHFFQNFKILKSNFEKSTIFRTKQMLSWSSELETLPACKKSEWYFKVDFFRLPPSVCVMKKYKNTDVYSEINLVL